MIDRIAMVSEEELEKIKQWGKSHMVEPQAKSAEYDRSLGQLTIELTNGAKLYLKPSLLKGSVEVTPEQIEDFHIAESGSSLRWESLGVSVSIPKLFADRFGSESWMVKPSHYNPPYPDPAHPDW